MSKRNAARGKTLCERFYEDLAEGRRLVELDKPWLASLAARWREKARALESGATHRRLVSKVAKLRREQARQTRMIRYVAEDLMAGRPDRALATLLEVCPWAERGMR